MNISIILPIYNVADFLPTCLDSLLSQSYADIEILLIDDGSLDSSGEVCDRYASRDSRIKVFHTPNRGVAKARELGVKESHGEWIAFVDPDDWVPEDAIQTLAEHVHPDLDIIIGSFCAVSDKHTRLHPVKEERLTRHQYISQLFVAEFNPSPWAKLYRRALFGEDSFPQLPKGQDYLMNFEICGRIREVIKINRYKSVYFYRADRDSSTTNHHKLNLEYEKLFYHTLYSIMQRNNLADRYKHELTHFALRYIGILIKYGVRFDVKDEWIRKQLMKSQDIKLSLKELIITRALQHSIFREFVYLGCRIYRSFSSPMI